MSSINNRLVPGEERRRDFARITRLVHDHYNCGWCRRCVRCDAAHHWLGCSYRRYGVKPEEHPDAR